jgi:hypothetical protein
MEPKSDAAGFSLFIDAACTGAGMKKASEYREHAEQCRTLAKGMPLGAQRDQLLEMAATWDKLAIERSDLIRRHPELALRGEHDEEIAGAKTSNG